ncbi:hypothetical protein CBER1_03820 [Cercospora berteroae]|uniref:Uncharacterized protein n=1 Tax=Cercospora berteroae TaxID=357750 RepID=A0A2S6CEA9_9PEZI|nr:hypothetical protein CBER1_03820 [Cercospora berteroae]
MRIGDCLTTVAESEGARGWTVAANLRQLLPGLQTFMSPSIAINNTSVLFAQIDLPRVDSHAAPLADESKMPHRGGATTPQPEQADSPLSSAARDALQSNLDSTLTLNRKKSWFGSAREVFQRGAKGVVGHLRSGDRKGSQEEIQEYVNIAESTANTDAARNVDVDLPNADEENSSGSASVGESHSSLTPLRPTRADRQKTFTPKSAMNSLRQHIHASGKEKSRRAALSDITSNGVNSAQPAGRTSTEIATAAGDSQREVKSPTRQHGRTSSVARSVIGSLRGLSRRGTTSNPTSPASDNGSPTKRAAAIPLPSSPIDVPAPTLKLNLRDSPSLSAGFLYSPSMTDQNSELMSITNPVNQGSMKVPTYYTRLPGEGPTDAFLASKGNSRQLSGTLSEFLRLPTDEFEFSTPDRPSTPMPGTGAQLELDGNVDVFDEPPLFERSVEARDTPEKRDNKTLKKMISLDALAEQHIRDSPRRGIRLTPSSATHKVRNVSNTTSGKHDQPPLKLAALSTPSAGHRDPVSGHWSSEDPFAPGKAVGDLAAASPGAVSSHEKLRDNPATTVQSTNGDGGSETDSSALERRASSTAQKRTPSIEREMLPEDTALLGQSAARKIAARAISGQATALGAPEATRKVPSGMENFETPQDDTKNVGSQTSSRLSSAQFDQFHPEHFLGLEDCERGDPPPSMADSVDGKSTADRYRCENEHPSTAPLYQRVAQSQTPSPSRLSTGLERSSDVGEVFWRFSVQDWMHKGGHAATPNLEPSPRQGSVTISIDSVSERRVTPPVSPTVTTPGPSPSMGNRLSFELKRSNRNMRYNALTEISNESSIDHEDDARGPTSMRSATSNPFRLPQSGDVSKAAEREQSFPTFESVFPPSARSSPSRRRSPKRSPGFDPSSDSIESGLQEAITDHYVFQNALAGADFLESLEAGRPATDQAGHDDSETASDVASLAECERADLKDSPQLDGVRVDSLQSSANKDRECSAKDDDGSCDEVPGEENPASAQEDRHVDVSATAQSDADSLDDCLHLYQSYEACQGRFPEEAPSSDAVISSSPPSKRAAMNTSWPK